MYIEPLPERKVTTSEWVINSLLKTYSAENDENVQIAQIKVFLDYLFLLGITISCHFA